MYLYLFDSFLAKRKYKKILDRIETRITDLEISGRIIKLTILESIPDLIKEATKKGVKTVVAVGNDKTFCQAASALANSETVLGFIPIGEGNKISEILDIPKEELACEVISARLIENLDLGKINHHFFISSVEIKTNKVILESDNFKIHPSSEINKIYISNLNYIFNKISNPKDGLLEIILEKESWGLFPFFGFKEKMIDSLFFLKKLGIKSPENKKGVPVVVDNYKILKTPLTVEILPNSLKVIVGKERKF